MKDGPAAGKVLALRNAPLFLRVTLAKGGKVDALDMPCDEPTPDETLVLYRRDGEATHALICSRSRGRGLSGRYAVATYRVVETQPSDATLRSREEWRKFFCAALAEVHP
jgi:hypothetical protein